MYLYAKVSYVAKYEFSVNNLVKVGLKYYSDSKAFIEYSSDMHDVYKIIDK